MTLTIYDKLEQGSDDWFAQRRGMVTASVVGSLLSVRKWGALDYDCPNCSAPSDYPCIDLRKQTPMKGLHAERTTYASAHADSSPLIVEPSNGKEAHSLTALLAAERITGWTDPTFMSDDMYRGKEDEPRAIEAYSEHHAPVDKVGFMVCDDWGFSIGFSPDGLVGEEGAVEVKSRRSKNQLLTVLSGDVPAVNYAQLQTGLLVSGRKWIDYLSYTSGMPLWKKRVYPDPKWHAAIVAAVKQFEATADDMITRYNAAVIDLPMTERVEYDTLELKL